MWILIYLFINLAIETIIIEIYLLKLNWNEFAGNWEKNYMQEAGLQREISGAGNKLCENRGAG